MGIWVFYPWHKLFLWVLKFIFQCAERRFSFDSRSSYLKIIFKIFTHFCSIFMHWCYLHINLWSIWNLFWFKDPDSFVPRELHCCPSSCLPSSPHSASLLAAVLPAALTLLWFLRLCFWLTCHGGAMTHTINLWFLSLSSGWKRCTLLLMLSVLKTSEILVICDKDLRNKQQPNLLCRLLLQNSDTGQTDVKHWQFLARCLLGSRTQWWS